MNILLRAFNILWFLFLFFLRIVFASCMFLFSVYMLVITYILCGGEFRHGDEGLGDRLSKMSIVEVVLLYTGLIGVVFFSYYLLDKISPPRIKVIDSTET